MFSLDFLINRITLVVFVGLLAAVILFPDLVAVIIIVGSVSGLALNWLSRELTPKDKGWQKERERWQKGDRWW